MKKLFGTLLLLVCMTLIFVGCAGTGEDSKAKGSGNEDSDAVTITMSDYFTNKQPDQAINELIKKFEENHPDINVERTTVPYSQFLPTTLRQAKTDSLPTVLLVDNLNIPAMVEAGALTPIEELGEVDKSQYLKGPISTVTYNDKLYGLPFGSNDLTLFYNKDMFEEAGVKPPNTWDELLEVSKKVAHDDTYGIAFSAPSNQQATWQFAPFLWAAGGSLQDLDSPESIKALNYWKTLVDEGAASTSVVNFSQTQVYNEFAAERAAMMVMGPWMVPSLNETDINYGIVPLPTPKADQDIISPIGGEDLTVTTSGTEEQKQAAWTFIQWIQDEERLPQIDKTLGYVPAYKPAFDVYVEKYPEFEVFAEVLKTAESLTKSSGAKFPEVSQHTAEAIQKVLTGSSSAEDAAKNAAEKIEKAMKK